MLKYLWFSITLVSLNVALADRPNVVVLLVDDFSAGALSGFGSDFHETPNIDKLAESGAIFTQAYAACTVCSPSRAAILTGKVPARIKLTDWIPGRSKSAKGQPLQLPDWKMYIDHDEITLAEALKESDYTTGFFGKWHLMPPNNRDAHTPEKHGFDLNIGGREWGRPKGKGRFFHPFGMPNLTSEPGDFLTDRLTDYTLDFIKENTDKPFLVYLSYYTIHTPIMGKPELVAKYEEKLASGNFTQDNPAYAAMVESLDQSVGRILEALKKEGLLDNTYIFFTGDNGADMEIYTGGLKNRKAFAHEGGVREPFFVSGPGIAKNQVIDTPVIGMDIYPTILDLLGLPLKPQQHMDGLSLKPLLMKQGSLTERDLYWHYPHYHRTTPYGAIVSGDYKLIEFYEDGELELYDLKNDPFESKNLASTQPEKASALLANLNSWKKEVGAQEMLPRKTQP